MLYLAEIRLTFIEFHRILRVYCQTRYHIENTQAATLHGFCQSICDAAVMSVTLRSIPIETI